MKQSSVRDLPIMVAVILLFAGITGCGSTGPTSDYGAIDGATAKTSPNGFSILRHLCVESGYAVTTLANLPSNGEKKLSTLIWAPHAFRSHDKKAMEWVERWLKSGNKTFVYVAADYAPMVDYWKLTSSMHESEKETRNASINAALEQSSLLNKLASGYRTIAFPWGLYRKELGELEEVRAWSGDWSEELDLQNSNLKLRSFFQPWGEVSDAELEQLITSQGMSKNASNTASSKSPSSNPQPKLPPGFNASWLREPEWGEEYALEEKARREAIAASEEIALAETKSDNDIWAIFGSDAADATSSEASRQDAMAEKSLNSIVEAMTCDVLLQEQKGAPFLSVLTKPSWNGSQIVLVANSSLFSNLSLTYKENQKLTKRLLDTFTPGRVGFLSRAGEPIVLDGENGSTGLAALLTQPVNLLAAHLVFLGLVALLYLWPIFGRPLELPTPSTQSFSLHINALGSLLQKTGDQFYARTTIADYFRQVKKDHNSVWSRIDSEYTSNTSSPFRQDEVNSAAKNTNG